MANDPERRLEERRGVPVPVDPIESMSSGTQYATSMEITTEITPDEMLATYQDETGDMGWVISGHEKLKSGDKLTFEGPQGELIVKITPTTNGSKVEANLRDADAAKADGMLPLPGKAKLILANASDKDVVITIGKNDYQVKAGVGADDPTKAINYDVAAGKYSLTIKVPRESPQKESLVIEVGTSWGLIITPSGEAFADQIY